jgi:hypothetical protein
MTPVSVGQNTAQSRNKGVVSTSTLVLLAFFSAFYSRIIDAVGAPSTINFLHFATVPLACYFALSKARTKIRLAISRDILFALLLLLMVTFASALLNNAGAINAILDFLLLTEAFILLLAIVCIPMSPEKTEKFRLWVVGAGFINLFLALVQRFVFKLHLREGLEDNIKGVFLNQGAGHVVGASVSLTFGLYYLFTAKTQPLWFRLLVLLATLIHVIVADAKQVLSVFMVAFVLLFFSKLKNIGTFLKYAIGAALVISGAIWLALNGFIPWDINMTLEGMKLKLVVFSIFPSFYETPLHPFLGLGPGHTVGRLGGWMLSDYWDLLGPLDATRHPASRAVWQAVGASWFGDKSSMFSPLFGWAGIWGDLGILGLAAYLYLASLVWRHLCFDDLSRFFLLTVFVFGLIFSQMEEPGYMLFMATIIGLRWQEHQSEINSRGSFKP